MLNVLAILFILFDTVHLVKPIWKTPISGPNQIKDNEHLVLSKRDQPNYYTRPEQFVIPDYRSPQQVSHRIENPVKFPTSGGHFRPFAWIGPEPQPGTIQNAVYNEINKNLSFNELPPLPSNWKNYPVQMIWIPDGPGSSYNPYYVGPSPPDGKYGPKPSTTMPMEPSVKPENYMGTIAHSPSIEQPTTPVSISTYTVNPTIRPGPQEPSNNKYSEGESITPTYGSLNSVPPAYVSTSENDENPYQSPANTPDDSHLNIHFKKPFKSCNSPYCITIDNEKVSLYNPDRYHKGPTLVISNTAKDDAVRNGYRPHPPPLLNPYAPPPPPPRYEDYATPYTSPPEYQAFPPYRSEAPKALIPAHNFPPPTVVKPSDTVFEETTTPFEPTAQTIQTTTNIEESTTIEVSRKTTSYTNGEPEYMPPSIMHMTTMNKDGEETSTPTYVPINEALTTTTETKQPKLVMEEITRKPITMTNRSSTMPSANYTNISSTIPIEHTTTAMVSSTVESTTSTSPFTHLINKSSTISKQSATTPLPTSRLTTIELSTISSTSSFFVTENTPPRQKNPYAPPNGSPIVPNRVIGKPKIECQSDGIHFEVKTIQPLTGELFAMDRKRVPGCHKILNNETRPSMFFQFEQCGIRNINAPNDTREQYHIQIVVQIKNKDYDNVHSYMAQCVHQKVNYNKQKMPKRIEEALEELNLFTSKIEQKSGMPSASMKILVDRGHHRLGEEVGAADIGMSLALNWKLEPESDAYGLHVRSCKVVDAYNSFEHTIIDEKGCSADLQIIDHPHYDTYHDTATAHMWAFKIPDMNSLIVKCDILICSNIKSSLTNTSSCDDIPSPPYCADVITSPPNSILSDVSSYVKSRRQIIQSSRQILVRAALCVSENCLINDPEELRVCVNTHLAVTSTAISLGFTLFALIFQWMGRKRMH